MMMVGALASVGVLAVVSVKLWTSKGEDVTLSNQRPQQLAQATATPEVTATPEPTKAPEIAPTPEPTKSPEPAYVGVSEAGKKFTYDAKKISNKLSKYDYKNNGEKIVFLTFDDGTSTTVTPKILKVLEDNNVHATFFLTGSNIERGGKRAKELVKKEFEAGHAIANHSYSHDYKKLYPNRKLNLNSFLKDFAKTDKILKEILGDDFSTRVIRCPGGFMSWKNMSELSNYMEENNMVSIDWNALNKDAEGGKKNADQLYKCAVETAKGKEIVVLLMHDTYGKEETAKALPKIIKHFKSEGYEFKTLS